MSAPPSLRVPTEVWELIIDEVAAAAGWKVHETLQSCALVCGSWRPRAQRHLFRTVTIRHLNDISLLASLFKDTPKLSSYVEELELVASIRYDPTFGYLPEGASVLSSPYLLGRGLSSLRVLSLSSRDVHPYSERQLSPRPKCLPHLPLHPSFPKHYSSVSHVSTLHLHNITFPTLGDLVKMLFHLPHVSVLRCIGVFYYRSWSGDVLSYGPGAGKEGGRFLPNLKDFTFSSAPQAGVGTSRWSSISDNSRCITLRDLCALLGAIDPRSLCRLSIPFETCENGAQEETSREWTLVFRVDRRGVDRRSVKSSTSSVFWGALPGSTSSSSRTLEEDTALDRTT